MGLKYHAEGVADILFYFWGGSTKYAITCQIWPFWPGDHFRWIRLAFLVILPSSVGRNLVSSAIWWPSVCLHEESVNFFCPCKQCQDSAVAGHGPAAFLETSDRQSAYLYADLGL